MSNGLLEVSLDKTSITTGSPQTLHASSATATGASVQSTTVYTAASAQLPSVSQTVHAKTSLPKGLVV